MQGMYGATDPMAAYNAAAGMGAMGGMGGMGALSNPMAAMGMMGGFGMGLGATGEPVIMCTTCMLTCTVLLCSCGGACPLLHLLYLQRLTPLCLA